MSKYESYVISEDLMPPLPPEDLRSMEEQAGEGRTLDRTLLLGIQNSILKGAFFAGCEWLWQLTGDGPVSIELLQMRMRRVRGEISEEQYRKYLEKSKAQGGRQ